MKSSVYLIGDTSAAQSDIFAQLSESRLQSLILEAGNITQDLGDVDEDGQTDDYVLTAPRFTQQHLYELTNQTVEGATRGVLAYVNVMVPDFNRYYWERDWITAAEEDPTDLDYGTVRDGAPGWLEMNLGIATGPEFGPNGEPGDGIFGFLVDYRDTDWQELVITQAIAYVEHGYTGIFLDDVGRYDETSLSISDAAAEMMRFVLRIQEGVTEATGLTANELTITINSDPYIINNYFFAADRPDSFDLELVSEFAEAVDGLVTENATSDPVPFWDVANKWFNGTNPDGFQIGTDTTDLTAIETPKDWAPMMAIVDELIDQNVSLFLARGAAYNQVLNAPIFGTAEAETLTGTALAEAIFGGPGTTSIEAGAGDDIIYGAALGGAIRGGDGDDLIYGGPGDDLIFGGAGNDTIYGGGGNDTIIGGAGDDLLYGGDPPDELVF